MEKKVYLTGSNESLLIVNETWAGRSRTYSIDATQINDYIDYVVDFLRKRRYLLTYKPWRGSAPDFRKEKICWIVIRLLAGIRPTPIIQDEVHNLFNPLINSYGWDVLRMDLWQAAFEKMPRLFKGKLLTRNRKYADYMPYFLKMFPYYVVKRLNAIKYDCGKTIPLPGDIAIELNDDYFDEAKDRTHVEILNDLISFRQTTDTIQNMYYYLNDMDCEESKYIGFGQLLGYDDLYDAGYKRLGNELIPK